MNSIKLRRHDDVVTVNNGVVPPNKTWKTIKSADYSINNNSPWSGAFTKVIKFNLIT